METILKNRQYYKFCFYGFLKNLRFFDAFFILFLVEKGLPFTQIGILYAIREIVTNILEIPSGIVADTYGRRNALAGSLFAFILSFLLFYFSESFLLFTGAFVLYGIGDAFRSGTHKGMMMDYLKMIKAEQWKISYYGHTRSWSMSGSALSALLAGIIVFFSGNYELIFLFSILPYLANFFLILSYPSQLNMPPFREKARVRFSIRETTRSFIQSIRQPGVFRIINSSALHTAYLRAGKDYIQLVMVNVALLIPFFTQLEQGGRNGLFIGIFYFIIFCLTAAASRFASTAAAWNRKRIAGFTLLSGLVLGSTAGILFYFNLWALSLLAFTGVFIVENIRKPVLTGFVADNVPNDILTSVISAQSLLRTIITAVLALGLGLLADHLGIGPALALLSGTLILLYSIGLTFGFKNP